MVWCYSEMFRLTLLLSGIAIQYDTIGEFNMDSIAECDQLNLAHVASSFLLGLSRPSRYT